MYVCLCADKTEQEIYAALKSGKDISEITEELGVCGGCGTCEEYVEELLEQVKTELDKGQAYRIA